MPGFNPRAREGRDAVSAARAQAEVGFNPRAREGRDALTFGDVSGMFLFHSTRPRGARP